MAQVGLQPVCHTLGSCHVVLLAHSFKRKHLLNPLLRPRNRATYKKGNTHLIKSQSPITRESEKEMKWLICTEAHSLLAALYALFHLVLTALLLRGRYYCILWVMKLKLRKSNNLCKSQNWYKKKKTEPRFKTWSNSQIFAPLLLWTTIVPSLIPRVLGKSLHRTCPRKSLWVMPSSYIGFALENKLQRFHLSLRASGLLTSISVVKSRLKVQAPYLGIIHDIPYWLLSEFSFIYTLKHVFSHSFTRIIIFPNFSKHYSLRSQVC